MTGYANLNFHFGETLVQIDIRSVNHRFLDISLKCPEEFKCFEPDLREIISNQISRGKIDLRIIVQESHTNNFTLNQSLLSRYSELTSQIKQQIPDISLGSTIEVISLPGMITKNSINLQAIKPKLVSQVELLVTDLLSSQMAEGEKLFGILHSKIQQMNDIVVAARALLPEVIDNYKNKLRQKLLEALAETTLNEQRLQQEFAYFCQKIDVDEELSRLETHLGQFTAILNKGGMVGKKIDFLTQEMHREANTFGAKSISISTTNFSLELKILIEQIKEQIQNIT